MLRKFAFGAAIVLLPVGVVIGAVPGVASASSSPPIVRHIAPHHGPAIGGTSVAVEGADLAGATAVDFGTKPARSFSTVSGRIIVAVSPSGTGTVDITVTTPAGTSATSSKDQFAYAAKMPVVSTLFPRHGRPAGGTSVTIIGHDFTGATAVDFGNNPGIDLTVFSHSVISVKSPAGSGTVDVTVTTPLGTSAVNRHDQFTYTTTLPTVTNVSPHVGVPAGGTTVTIRGSNLTGATAVDFGTNAATNVTVITSHLISATTPSGTGTVDVTVTTPDGTSATDTGDQFTYATFGPTVTHVAPHRGAAAGGTSVAITGRHLNGATAVDFGSTPATGVRVVSSKVILATAPAGTGTVDVTVTTPLGTSPVTAKDQYTYR